MAEVEPRTNDGQHPVIVEAKSCRVELKTTLDYARWYLSKGFSIIPVRPSDKNPAIDSWKIFQEHKPTEDNLKIWFGNGSQNNLGIVTGKNSGIAVVDLDSKEAVEFAKNNHFPQTPLVKTGKKEGYHLYCLYKQGSRNFQKRDNLPGIDLRSEGGYVVAPPSIHPSGAQYQWVKGKSLDDLPLAELPEIILVKSPEEKTPLRELYQGVPEGQRNDTLARLTGSWVNDGLTLNECFENAHLWNSKNPLPLLQKEIETTVRSIFEKHHRDKRGADSEQTDKQPSCLLDSLLKWNDILNLDVSIEYILEKLIPKNSITLLFGRGGIGKTSLCMQIARAIASGTPFDTLQTIQAPVYYIDFENPLAVLKDRVEKIGQSENLYVWHISNEIQPPKLDSTGWELYKQLPPGLLTIDTLRASHLSDENDSKPMSAIMGRLKELREIGFTILLLHHTPKGNENTFKGSTALLDLCDHVLGLEEVKDFDGESIEFDCQNLYKLGTRIKTRYEPYSIYLTFNPEIKGFNVAVDPNIEKMEGIHEILRQSPEPLKQKELRERIKNDMDLSDKEVWRLLKKGTGLYWNIEKGSKNATLYIPLKSCFSVFQPLNTHKTEKQKSEESETVKNRTLSDISQTLDSSEFGSFSEGGQKTEKQEVIDLEKQEIEIVE